MLKKEGITPEEQKQLDAIEAALDGIENAIEQKKTEINEAREQLKLARKKGKEISGDQPIIYDDAIVATDDVAIDFISERSGNKPCPDCDTIRFKMDEYADLKSLWAIANHFGLKTEEVTKLNKPAGDFTTGDIVNLPKGTLKKKTSNIPTLQYSTSSKNVGGDPNGKKIVLVSWTFDDGPVPMTDKLREDFKVDNTTFFIVKSNMLTQTGGWKANVKRYKEWIAQGASVGIHAQHPKIDHIRWFPAPDNIGLGSSYSSIELAMKDMATFQQELKAVGINPKFVRPAGGLASQLEHYAKKLKFSDPRLIRNAILQNKKFNTLSLSKYQEQNYNKIAKDYNFLKQSLSKFGLYLWGGTINPNQISPTSWQAASADSKDMNDDVTRHVSHKDKRTEWEMKQSGKFERLVGSMKEGETKSLVILAHDTKDHAKEVLADKAIMEAYAKKNRTRIEYVNLSQLFDRITNKKINDSTPNY